MTTSTFFQFSAAIEAYSVTIDSKISTPKGRVYNDIFALLREGYLLGATKFGENFIG